MRREILNEAVKLNIEHRRRKWWHRVVSAMAAMVVFVTTYALILPAITMEDEAICGMQPHTHTEACRYTPALKMGMDFRCTQQVHIHEESCLNAEGQPVCLYADFVVHTHDAFCVNPEGAQVCTLEEHKTHVHSEACFERFTTSLCAMEEGEGAHVHGDSCYSEPQQLCGLIEGPGHSHEESCYGERPLICQPESAETVAAPEGEEAPPVEAHIHDESCYGQPELICGQQEYEPHTHAAECFGEKQLNCGLEENPGHVHEEACGVETEWRLVCEEPEISLHTHSEECLDAAGNLICGTWQIEEHQHTESCYAEHVHTEGCYEAENPEAELICPYHVHAPECCDEAGQLICGQTVLICGMEEHTHQDSCYPEQDDGLVEIRFEIPQEYTELISSETGFPAVYTLETGKSIAELGTLPQVSVTEAAADYLQEYHWFTPEGFPVDVTAAVTEDLVLTLKLYSAESPEAAKLVTATFVNGEDILLTRQVNAGTVVSELLDTEIMQKLDERRENNWHFEGWSYTNEAGEKLLLETGVTVIQEDTVYCAEFREYVEITLHDIDPEGQEYPDSPKILSLASGSSLSGETQTLLGDGTPITDCLWYTHAGEPFALDTPITEAIHLYTYSYTLVLNMQPWDTMEPAETAPSEPETTETPVLSVPMLMRAAFAAEADVISSVQSDGADGGDSDNVSIVKRRGAALTESDFLLDGVNLTDYQWEDASGSSVDADDLVGTSLTANYALALAADSDYTIRYNINVSQNAIFGTSPTVGGETYIEDPYNTSDGSYTIRVPNPTQYMVTNGNKRTLYQFTGWIISRNNHIIEAGETVDASWVASNVNRWQSYVTLTAQWTAVTTTETVHFFVNLNCQVADVDGNTGVPSSGDFTPSVYSTTMTVTGSDMKNYWQGPINRDGYSTQYVVLRADNASQTEAIDAEIRRLITGHDSTNDTYGGNSVWKSGYNKTKIFQVDDFPSDEHVLSVVRSMINSGTVIRMNGVPLIAEEVTPDNFTVRWNVCKYDTGDGWHIDGILVGKQAHLTVKKVFMGDEAAVQAVQNGNYSITLDNTSNSSAANLTLSLNPRESETASNTVGYTSYDAASQTYSWTVALPQENYYKIIENNYICADDAVQTSAVYTISNSPDAFAGWEAYPQGGIPNVRSYAYASDISASAYQTVTIRNSYVKSDTLTIHKIDLDTGHGLPGVSYRLTDSAGQPLTLYQKPGASYYSMKEEDLNNGFERIADSIITTDRNGTIFLKLENSTFTLEEAFPTGYGGVSKITVTVGVDSSGSVVFDEISSTDSTIEVDGTLIDKNTATLTVRNVSFPTSVTAKKVWMNSSDAKPVTVALYRNGVDMGASYQVILNAANNWTHTWNDLPLYVDGAGARYSLREIKIGDTNYDPSADNDGYAGYIVSYDELTYYKNGNPVSGPFWTDENGVIQYADNARLTVRNDVYRGQMMFLKVDGQGQPLAGAKFRLYSDENQTELVAEATSDEYGRVIFENLMPDTYYVMKESNTPEGYVGGDSLYKIRLTSQGSTTVEDSVTGEALTAIVNYLDKANVELLKVSSYGTVLSNAHFQLQMQEEGEWVSLNTGQTDEAGILSLGELSSGSYRLTETRAPDGFMSLPEPILFAIDQGVVHITNPNSLWTVTEGEEEGSYIITVKNETGYVLPRTGGITPEVYSLLGTTLMLASLAVLVMKRRRGGTSY